MGEDRLGVALRSLEGTWHAAGAPTGQRLAPGIQPRASTRILEDAGFPVCNELLTWFAWHNGREQRVADVALVQELQSLEEAIAASEMEIRLAEEMAELLDDGRQPPAVWDPTWLPLIRFVSGGWLAASPNADPCDTVQVWRYHHDQPPGGPIACSLAELVEGWATLVDGRWWVWNSAIDNWDRGSSSPPPAFRSLDP